ncbi:MAG: Gfo/Idh/MocA family oxidoreductase [Planctomycetes bacterium]|nr:Gfo/Idh/MocA family oxidoreductase [Planctomycetota bacterium]MBL7044965.1 Gfo/Idh/MocA family oxidoreductase [Pirellulaceae bacterium]
MKKESKPSRRKFLELSGAAAAVAATSAMTIPTVHAAEDNTIRLALIGCGGRGSGAVGNAMNSANGPVKLVAMADVVEDRLTRAHKALSSQFADRMDVPKERQFIGFDAYKKAIDCLGSNDVAMLTNFAYFRPSQLEYAVKKGVNVFMEKSFAPDGPGLRRLIRAGEEAKKKNLKIAAGLQCRHSVNRQELIKRIRDGALGEPQLIRAYRIHRVGGMGPKPKGYDELLWQIRNFTRFFWVSGGLFAEMNVHQIDEICWLKDALPVTARGIGGRAANSTNRGQGFDSISIEWTFPDGTKATDGVRWLGGHCFSEFATFVHGTKCAAQFSGNIHAGTTRIYKDQRITDDNIVWDAPKEQFSPWDAEWNVLLDSIRNDKPQNEAERAAMSNFADLMGRAAVHSGKEITWDEMFNSKFQFVENIDDMDYDTEPPVKVGPDGYYPVPIPGEWSEVS